MQLELPHQIARRLRRELRRAGGREIGGLLMGEHVRDHVFRIADVSVQRSGGSRVCFVRHPQEHERELKRFFERTGEDYTRFNYLGEWHSHPSFAAVPSATDLQTMQSIVADASVGVNFLVLIVAKLASHDELQLSATVFRAEAPPLDAFVEIEPDNVAPERSEGWLLRWIRTCFGAES